MTNDPARQQTRGPGAKCRQANRDTAERNWHGASEPAGEEPTA